MKGIGFQIWVDVFDSLHVGEDPVTYPAAVGSHGLKEEHARLLFQQIILAADYCHR